MVITLASFSCSTPLRSGIRRQIDPLDEVIYRHSNEVKQLYAMLKIRSLADISETSYIKYKKYVLNNTVYVLVHPAYYIFFHDNNENKIYVDRGNDFSKNIVDLFIDDFPVNDSKMLEQMKLSTNMERVFLGKKSLNQNLVIVVLPPKYRTHPEYPYNKLDEYGRYLNDVTQNSPSILYIESESYKSGYLTRDTLSKVRKLFNALEIKTVYVSGGYTGGCVQNFYEQIVENYNVKNIELVPEMCIASPDIMNH
jgi:hypothetical protein